MSLYTEPLTKNVQKKVIKKEKKDEPIKQKNEDKSTAKSETPASISSLFDTVSTKKPTRSNTEAKKIEISKEFRQAAQKRTKTKTKKEPQKSAKEIADSLKEKSAKLVISQPDATPASKGLYNEYYAKIQALIYKHWNPSPEVAGSTAKIRLELFKNGSVSDVRVITYSENELFNYELEEFIEHIKGLIFPLTTKDSVIEIYIGAQK